MKSESVNVRTRNLGLVILEIFLSSFFKFLFLIFVSLVGGVSKFRKRSRSLVLETLIRAIVFFHSFIAEKTVETISLAQFS